MLSYLQAYLLADFFQFFLPISQHYFSIKTSSNVFTVILYFLACVQLVFG